MVARYQALWQAVGESRKGSIGPLALVSVAALVLMVAGAMYAAAFVAERVGSPGAARVFPATLIQHLASPTAGGQTAANEWRQPSAVAVLEGRRFVLDTGNDQILELDDTGIVRRVFDRRSDGRLALQGAMAITSDNRYLYVANSDASQLLVLEPTGEVAKVLDLEKVSPQDEAPPRPIGLAVAGNGELLVSDADNHRVLRYDRDGRLLQAIGSGTRDTGASGFSTPGGLALDDKGNVYVVDILNGRVVQLSADGTLLRQFGHLGDTAGTLSRPKDVAVDSTGRVYISDSLQASVQVFGPQGEYLGFIGRENTGDRNSVSLFKAPAGLTIRGGDLHVVDRFGGLFLFQLPSLDKPSER